MPRMRRPPLTERCAGTIVILMRMMSRARQDGEDADAEGALRGLRASGGLEEEAE